MNERFEHSGSLPFLIGLAMGAAAGAGLAMWFAPLRGSELRGRLRASVTNLGDAASDSLHEATTRMESVIDGVAAKGRAVRDDVADGVGRGARHVERLAMASKDY